MTQEEFCCRCEAVLGLPLPKQAVCVRLAAEVSAPVWRRWCERHRVPDHSGELLDTFDRWLSGTAADDELDRVGKRFLDTLPQDLREDDDPTGGYAGWALLDIAPVALGQGEEVHDSILHTAVCYAAAAHCRVRVRPTEVSWVRLTAAELEFLDQWWRRCCERFPELAGVTVPAEPVELPTDHRPGVWAFLVGVLVCRILNSLHWALVGGLGWGIGMAAGNIVPFPGADTFGGAVGLALVMLGVLTIGLGKGSEFTPMYLASFSGVAFACVSMSFPHSRGLDLLVVLGAGVGFFVGLISCVMKQYFAPVSLLSACLIALTGAALFAGIGSLVGGMIGWAAAGGISLFCVAILAECLRREPAVEIDANEQLVRVIPGREMCRQTARQSWSLTFSLAWGWHGLFAGLLGSLWAYWAADRLALDTMRKPIFACGGIAAVLILVTRLGILKQPRQAQPSNGTS